MNRQIATSHINFLETFSWLHKNDILKTKHKSPIQYASATDAQRCLDRLANKGVKLLAEKYSLSVNKTNNYYRSSIQFYIYPRPHMPFSCWDMEPNDPNFHSNWRNITQPFEVIRSVDSYQFSFALDVFNNRSLTELLPPSIWFTKLDTDFQNLKKLYDFLRENKSIKKEDLVSKKTKKIRKSNEKSEQEKFNGLVRAHAQGLR